MLLSAKDGGGIPKVICNSLIELSTGEWLLPYWREHTEYAVVDGTCKSHDRSDRLVQVSPALDTLRPGHRGGFGKPLLMDAQEEVTIDGKTVTRTMPWPPGSDCFPEQPTPCNTGAREFSAVLRSTDHGRTWKVGLAPLLDHECTW